MLPWLVQLSKLEAWASHMNTASANDRSLASSYLTLRKTIGLLGIALPFVLSLGALLLFQTGIQSSLSSYYHTGMGDVFVGTLCAIGVFLLSYRGYSRADGIAGDLACVGAVGVVLFPVTPEDATASGVFSIGLVHLVFGGLFFSTLTYFSLVLFTKTAHDTSPTRRKLQRNKVYKSCGYTMAVCIVLMAVYSLLPYAMASLLEAYRPVFWLESMAVVAFGISWFTKGEAILRDEAGSREEAFRELEAQEPAFERASEDIAQPAASVDSRPISPKAAISDCSPMAPLDPPIQESDDSLKGLKDLAERTRPRLVAAYRFQLACVAAVGAIYIGLIVWSMVLVSQERIPYEAAFGAGGLAMVILKVWGKEVFDRINKARRSAQNTETLAEGLQLQIKAISEIKDPRERANAQADAFEKYINLS